MLSRILVVTSLLFVTAVCVSLADSVGGMAIQFLGLADGDVVTGTLNAEGQPAAISVRIRVTGPACAEVGLTADQMTVGSIANSAAAAPFEVVIPWTPAWGAGTYVLEAGATTADKSAYASAQITVTISGIPALARPPQPLSRDQAAVRIIALYKERFGITLTAPALARKERPGVHTDPWVSTAWIGSTFYQIDLFSDGHDESYAVPVGREEADAKSPVLPICRPEGTISMLVVFLDYGNLGVTASDVLSALEAATRRLNEIYALYPTSSGSTTPILQIRTQGVVIAPPQERNDLLLTPTAIRALTGFDPASFQLVALVDLDATDTARHAYVTRPNFDTFGLATGCCPCQSPDVDIWVGIDDRSQLVGEDSRLLTTLLTHEVFHHFGYPADHDWPCTDGTSIDSSDCCGSVPIPALFLGWTDTDGDGIPELLDPTPYGTSAAP